MLEQKHLNRLLNDPETVSLPRPYLGLSQIGEKCHRALQYHHYWAYEITISKRVQRLFKVGHREEQVIIDDLAEIGIFVTDSQEEMTGTAGHWKGHCDGIAIAEVDISQRFLVEFKTHSQKNFDLVKKNGVKKFSSKHYGQCMAYMGYLDLPYCLYVAYNKNTSEDWCEVIMFDEEEFKELKRKEMEVIASDGLLPRIGNGSPAWFECKFCDARKVCFGRELPPITCRSCQHVDIEKDGVWACSLQDCNLSVDDQKAACDEYQLSNIFMEEK